MPAHSGKFVSYYGVSTDRQGRSGLGLNAQKEAVQQRLNGGRWQLVAEFVESESGKRAKRPQLDAALAACKKHRAKLVVAKLDRLSRNVSFLLKLIDSGVEVLFADLPELNGAMGRFMLTTMASVAELEAGLISERTKAALKVAKARGVRLGRHGAEVLAPKFKEEARQRAMELEPVITELKGKGLSLAKIAVELNKRKVATPRGGKWDHSSVGNVLQRHKSLSSPGGKTMVKAYITSAVAGAFLLGMATAAVALTGEYGNMCTMGLALGKDIQTDCSINAQVQGKTYCFGSKEAMTQFMADPSGNLTKAQAYYSKKHPG